MMAAMMFPAPIPAVLAYAGFARARGEHMLLATLAFVGGYLVVCTLVMKLLGTGPLSFDHSGQNAFFARLEFAGP
jgi:predicted metal-binding membrane protein